MKAKVSSLAGKHLKEAEEFLAEIISIPSIGGENEEKVQKLIARRFAKLGQVEMRSVPESLKRDPNFTFSNKELDYSKRKNLVLRFPAGKGGRSLIVNSHSDTVGVENWSAAFIPKKEGNFIFGRGACDAKGQIATIYLALLMLKDMVKKLPGELIVEAVIEEEIGGNGALALIRQGYKADAALVVEPTELKIAPANRGCVWFKLEIEGKSLHMGRSWEGVNAIDKTCLIVAKLREYEKKLIAESRNIRFFEKHKQPVQVNFGVIKGEGWPSMVCGKVILEGGVGFLPNKNLGQVKQELDRVIKSCGDSWITKHYKFSFNKLHNDAYTIDGNHPFVKTLAGAAKAAGIEPKLEGLTASCDARLFNKVGGMPTVVFGPGSILDAHSCREKIDVRQMKKAAEILVRMITDWCGK